MARASEREMGGFLIEENKVKRMLFKSGSELSLGIGNFEPNLANL